MEIFLLFTISDMLLFRQKLDVNVYAGDRLDFHYIMLPLSIKNILQQINKTHFVGNDYVVHSFMYANRVRDIRLET